MSFYVVVFFSDTKIKIRFANNVLGTDTMIWCQYLMSSPSGLIDTSPLGSRLVIPINGSIKVLTGQYFDRSAVSFVFIATPKAESVMSKRLRTAAEKEKQIKGTC